MSKKTIKILLLLILFIAAGLFLINRDLFHYSFTFPYTREFESPAFEKGYSLILESLTLKPGVYQVRYTGETNGKLNGYSVRTRAGEILREGTFPEGKIQTEFTLELTGSAQQVQFGVNFEGDDSLLKIDQIRITAEHVLYKDSLIRHAVLSIVYITILILVFIRFFFPKRWERYAPIWIREQNERVFLFLLAITLFSCYPLLRGDGYVLADDMQYHLARIEGMAQSWQAGIFPARIHLFVIQNYGYGNGFYYPQLWLVIPAVLRCLGFSVMSCYNFFVVLCTFSAVLSVYSCTKHISNHTAGALTAAVIFAFAPYRLIDIYYRGALGEIQSFIFLPLIVYALYDRLVLHKDNWPLLALGFIGLLGSHIISFTIVCIITALFVTVSMIFTRERGKYLLFLVKAALLTTLLSSYFLIPMAEQWKKTGIIVNVLMSDTPGGIMESRELPWQNIFHYFQPWYKNNPWPGLSFPAVILCSLLCLKKKSTSVKTAHVLCALSVLCLWISTSLFPWEVSLFSWLFTRIQFTWRFLLISTVCLSIAGGIYIPLILEKLSAKITLIIVFAGTVLCAEPILYEAVNNRFVETPQFILQQNRIGGGEYLPRFLDIEFADKNRDTVLFNSNPIAIQDHDRQGLRFRFSYDLPEVNQTDVFEIPLAFYTGYHGKLVKSDGEIISLPVYQSSGGLTSVTGIFDSAGTIEVWYEKTNLQKTGEIITILTGISFITVTILRLKKTSGKKRRDLQGDCLLRRK